MIFSEQKMFAYKQQIALANSAVLTSVVLENDIDIGAAQVPYRGNRALKRNIGGGDGIPIMAFVTSDNTASATEYYFVLQVASGGAWRTVHTTNKAKGAGDYFRFKYLPDDTERYLRMVLNYKQDAATAGKTAIVTSAVGTYKPSDSRYV